MNRGTGAIPHLTRKEWAQGSLGAFILIAAMFAADALGGLAESTPQSPAPPVTGEGRSVQAKPGAAVPPRSAARTHASRSRLTPVRRSGTHLDVTAYCPTGHPTASGMWPREGMAAGNAWPFGTRLHVQGVGVVTVQDRYGWGTDLDLFMDSCPAARSFGRRHLLVEVVR